MFKKTRIPKILFNLGKKTIHHTYRFGCSLFNTRTPLAKSTKEASFSSSSSESTSSPSPSLTIQGTIQNPKQKNPHRLSSPASMHDTLEYPFPTQFAPLQLPSSQKLPSTPPAPLKNQTFLPHRPSPLLIRKSHALPQNPRSSEASLSSFEENSLALQKKISSEPVLEAVSSHKKSVIPIDSLLSSAGETSGDERDDTSNKNTSHVIDPKLLAEQKSLTTKVQDF